MVLDGFSLIKQNTGRDMNSNFKSVFFRNAFSNTTTSYKLLFMQALVKKIASFDKDDNQVLLDDVYLDMCVLAWYPLRMFNLSFGLIDKLGTYLSAAPEVINSSDPESFKAIFIENKKFELNKYVAHRILTPFFTDELKGVEDQKKNNLIEKLAARSFQKKISVLYKWKDKDTIIIHPEWISFIQDNLVLIDAWLRDAWIDFLQRKNPSVPAIPNKIQKPENRRLDSQRKFWKEILQRGPMRCIYSGVSIDPNEMSLDHYLPWSFVAHDNLWNLIPTIRQVNSSKNDSLPDMHYWDGFLKAQLNACRIAYKNKSSHKWAHDYLNDLHLSEVSELIDMKKLRPSYEKLVYPLYSLAEISGFKSGWLYNS